MSQAPQAPGRHPAAGFYLVGAARPGLVDRRAVRGRLVPVRARRSSLLCPRRGGLANSATFFAGSLFFASAGFLQYREAVDALPDRPGDEGRKKVFVFRPGQIDWLATAVQLIGTLAFNVSTGVAVWAATGTALARHHVWRPDVVGLSLLPDRERPGVVRGMPRLGSLAAQVRSLVDSPGSTWPGR